MAYGDFKATAFEKILCDKTFKNAQKPKYDGYQRGLHSLFYKFFSIRSLLHLHHQGSYDQRPSLRELREPRG